MFDPTISPIYDDVSSKLEKRSDAFYEAPIRNILPWGMFGYVALMSCGRNEWYWIVCALTDFATTAGHPKLAWQLSSLDNEFGTLTFPTKASALNDALESIYAAGLTTID